MKKLNLKKIIDNQHLDVDNLAKQLFPTAKHPKRALDRIVSGEALLDSNQISLLSMITDLPIGLLYEGGDWQQKEAVSNLLKFGTEDYTAELDTTTWITKIYHKESLFHESVICSGAIPLSDFLNSLTDLIIKNKKAKHEQIS